MSNGVIESETTTRSFQFQRADVILIHTKGSIISKLIQFGTESYWSHAALIYLIPSESDGFKNTFVIESLGNGIDIRNIDKYFKYPEKYDIGIKRLAAGWYGEGDDNDAHDFARLVRGFALQEIDDSYGLNVLVLVAARCALMLLQGAWLRIKKAFSSIKSKITGKKVPSWRLRIAGEPVTAEEQGLKVNSYICSGFVQWAYVWAMKIFRIKHHDNALYNYPDVTFTPRILLPLSDDALSNKKIKDELLSTTPADLANSNVLRWKIIIKQDQLFEIPPENQEKVVADILNGKIKRGYKFDFKNGALKCFPIQPEK